LSHAPQIIREARSINFSPEGCSRSVQEPAEAAAAVGRTRAQSAWWLGPPSLKTLSDDVFISGVGFAESEVLMR
jgi:hypothetical protein